MSFILHTLCCYMKRVSVGLHRGFATTMLWRRASAGEVTMLPVERCFAKEQGGQLILCVNNLAEGV